MKFEVLNEITNIDTIATGRSIRIRQYLNKRYGHGKWRKKKGFATVQFANGDIFNAEIHWYEAQGIGRKEIKIKRLL